MFRYYSSAISQASKNVAAGIFITGLLLIGFGFLIYVLRDLFAILFAILFVIAGIGCGVTAVKIFWAQSRLDKMNRREGDDGRENVRIHIERDSDI